MVKHSARPMRPYFTRERFGRSQFLAGLLLLVFLAQAVWLVHAELSAAPGLDSQEATRISEGLKQWHGRGVAGAPITEGPDGTGAAFELDGNGFDGEHSPLLYLVSATALLAWPRELNADSAAYWRWLPRLPFLACGMFLGASLWYVARRLCGNVGGFVALTLYCFSPAMIQAAAAWHAWPEIVAVWGAFGTIFTSIAVAHTLYAPREVVLWNWRRIVLLGVSFAIATGSEFALWVVVPMALGFLLYVAPVRRRAGLVIWVASCTAGFALFMAFYFLGTHAIRESMRHAAFWDGTLQGFSVAGVYKQVALQIRNGCPALAVAFPVAIVTYVVWPRTRYFGNTAPLLVAALFLGLAMAQPHLGGAGFLLASLPFLFIFVSGVLADLLETQYRPVIVALIAALLLTYVARTLPAVIQVPRG